MKSLKRKLRRVKFFPKTLFYILSIAYIVCLVFFSIYLVSLTNVETVLRYAGLICLVLFGLFYLYKGLCLLLEKKYGKYYILSLITIIVIVIMIILSNVLSTLFGGIENLTESDKVLYTSYLITLKDKELNKDSILGMIKDEDDIEGHILAKKIIKKNKLKQDVESYDTYLEMLYDLYDQKIDGIFVSNNYKTLFGGEQGFETIGSDTKIVYTYSEELSNSDATIKSLKSLKDPFTVLIMGVDSEIDGLNANAAFNGDTLILASVNPKTLTATLFSIPRDTYVPIACRNGAQFKINSSAAYGTDCVLETVEDLTNIDIDYYVKINFKGVVQLVDAVGGIEVDVEEPDFSYNDGINCGNAVCEQDSNRNFDNMIYVNPGLQTLNGEQALAYSRDRHQYLSSDLARNRHQQDVITALGKKAVKIKSYSQFKKVLDAAMNNISTNMSTNQILSGYNMLKSMLKKVISDDEFIFIQKTYLETYSLPVNYGDMVLSALGYYQGSLDDIVKTMNINLEKEQLEIIKTFSFSINDEYQEKIAGKGITTGQTNKTLKSFIGSTKEKAQEYCDEIGINCSFTFVDDTSKYYNDSYDADIISYQNPASNSIINSSMNVTFYINGAKVED